MLLPKKISAIRKNILTALVAVILLAIAYLVYTNFLAGMITAFLPQTAATDTEIADFTAPVVKTEINADFTGKAPYVNLTDSSVTVTVDGLGRSNPFAVIIYNPALIKK